MSDEFKQYIVSLYQDIPQEVYEGLLSVFCLGLVIFIAWKGLKTGLRYSAILLLVEYIFLLFCSTVFFRTTSELRKYDFHPFWSYSRPDLLVENIMNVIVFIPVGMILGSLLRVNYGSLLRVNYGSRLRVKGSWSRNGSWLMVKGSSTSERLRVGERSSGMATKSMTWLMVAIIGCGISVTIEALQFLFHRGFAETDDVMHNTLGCILGYILVKGSGLMVKTSK